MANPDPRIETLEREIATLVEQRQTLRATGGEARELERNRCEIVARQHEAVRDADLDLRAAARVRDRLATPLFDAQHARQAESVANT